VKLKLKFWTLVAKWKYRKIGYDEVCCCGNSMINIYSAKKRKSWRGCADYTCPSRCAKEYAITKYVEEKME
jgi:hypothetical protein